MCYNALIWWGEIWCWSLLGLKRLRLMTQVNQPMKTWSKYMWQAPSAGKRVRQNAIGFGFTFSWLTRRQSSSFSLLADRSEKKQQQEQSKRALFSALNRKPLKHKKKETATTTTNQTNKQEWQLQFLAVWTTYSAHLSSRVKWFSCPQYIDT